HAPEHRLVFSALQHLAWQGRVEIRFHESESDRIDVDVRRTEIHRGRFGDPDQGGLARGVVRDAEARTERLMARDVYDLAETLGTHRAGHRLNTIEGTGDVGVEHLPPRLRRQAPQCAVVGHPRVVHQIVDASETLADGGDELFHLVAAADVAGRAIYGHAQRADGGPGQQRP